MNIHYYLGFSYFLGIGPITFNLLLSHFHTVEKAYTASAQQLKSIIGEKLTSKFIEFREKFHPEKEFEFIQKNNIKVITREAFQFPNAIAQITDVPICIYVKGAIDNYDFDKDLYFAIVGTRKPTSYGEQVARRFSYSLAKEGVVIVSGMALGIDSVAHLAALDAGGRTIAFLGCGVNIVYPPSNKDLYNRILENGGLIISEFPPDMTVMPGLFVSRNRLISGLSKGILVAEGLKDSGSLITARLAAEQGKEVFAPPAPITSDQSEAPNILLKEGAKLVTTVEDIFEEFDLSRTNLEKKQISLSLQEHELFKMIGNEPHSVDQIARKMKVPVYKVLSVLSSMELKGIIEKNSEGLYQMVF